MTPAAPSSLRSHPHRVVVTGLGQVSSLGTNLADFAARVFAGEPGVSLLHDLDAPGLARPIGARIPGWNALDFLPAAQVQMTSPVAHYAYAAAAQAFAAAQLERIDRARGGVFVGSGFGGLISAEDTYRACYGTRGTRPRPTAIPLSMANAAAGLVAAELRLKGPNLTFCVACASGTHALGQAYRVLRSGDADVMVAGGVDAPLTPVIMAAWHALRVLAPAGDDPRRACRPFSRDRQGLLVGEGAGFLVLETLAHAEARGAVLLAEMVGYGANADAGHVTHPDVEGVARCMALALEDAGLPPEAIDYVNAHGTGTVINDRTEARAIADVFGVHASRLRISATKAVHGHAMGASGGLEAISTVLALLQQRVPPTANLKEIDPDIPALDYVPSVARAAELTYVMSNSFAFGGNNAVIVLKRA